MIIAARFNQSPVEVKRYLLDYTAQLATGETVLSITVVVSSPTDLTNAFVISGVAITPAGNQAAFFASAGLDQNIYNVQFVATTSLTQKFEDVVVFNVKEKLDA